MDKIMKPQARWRVGRRYKQGPTQWSPWSKNLICTGYAELVGGLLTQGTPGKYEVSSTPVNFSAVPVYMAIGTGREDWESHGFPPYTPGETHLVTEVSRLPCVVAGYLPNGATETTDPIVGASTPATIRRPVFSASWDEDDLLSIADPILIREVGLIGGPDAAVAGNPLQYLINLLRFDKGISKSSIDPFVMVFECELWINFD